VNNSNPH